MLNAVIRFALRYRMLVLVISIAMLAYGSYLATHMSIDVFPDLDRPRVIIITECPGLATEEVETLVTQPIEIALLGASGVQIGKYVMQAAGGCLGSESDRCNICNIGHCPKGITSQDPRLYRRLDVEKVAERVVDLFLSFDTELKKIVAPLGRSTPLPIGMADALGIADPAAAERLSIRYVV